MEQKLQQCFYLRHLRMLGVLLLMVCFWSQVMAQTTPITGTVISQTDKTPMVGVGVIIKGTQKGTSTDVNGKFTITAAPQDVLVLSYIGYDKEEIAIGAQTKLQITMKESTKALDEVVVIGYGSQRKREITGAVASVKSDDLQKIGGSNFAEAMQGQLAGVNIQASSGSPGSTANIQIRGIGSLSSGALSPLFVVDGLPYDGNPNLTSNEIESIEVLKDAASASIYGTRASNGVILITTKRGKAGVMKVDFDAYYGFQKITSGIHLLNTKDYLYTFMTCERLNNAPGESIFNPLSNNPRGLDYNTNWMNELTNDNAPIQNYSINVSGGRQELTYNVVLNYFDQEGSMIKTDYNALSLRSNTFFQKGRFTSFVALGLNHNNRDVTPWGLHDSAISLTPMSVPIDFSMQSGSVPQSDANRVGELVNTMKEENALRSNGFNGHVVLGYEIVDGLVVNGSFGASASHDYGRRYNPQFLVYDTEGNLQSAGRQVSELNETINMSQRYATEFTLKYDKIFKGGHSIKLLAGFSAEESRWDTRTLGKQGFPSDQITVPDAGTSADKAGGTNSKNTLVGMLARAMYNYNDKYMVSVSVRRDGSSRFGEQKWANFPSVSAGWGVSEEKFFKNSAVSNVLTNLKIRASLGTAGNQSIPNYSYDASIYNNLDYVLGNSDQSIIMQGAIQRGFANPLVQWETSVSRNIGLDMGLLGGAVTLTADYYYTNKKDMLLPVALAPSSGAPSGDWRFGDVQLNAGDMYNKGIELSLTYKGGKKDFRYSFSGVFTKNNNKVTRTYVPGNYLSGGVPVTKRAENFEKTTYIKEGYPAGSFFLIPNRGTIKTQQQLKDYKKIVGTAKLGDLWMVDTDGNGSINDDDRVYCGTGTPKWEAGLTVNLYYKNLDFNVQFYGTYGNMVYNGSKLQSYAMMRHQDLLYAWTPWNPTSNIPSPRKEMEHNNVRSINDYYLEDGSYLRVRNIQLGYTLPKAWLNKIKIRSVRVYLSAQNPFTFTEYTGYDPEVGGDGLFTKGVDKASYPISSQYRMGIQIGF